MKPLELFSFPYIDLKSNPKSFAIKDDYLSGVFINLLKKTYVELKLLYADSMSLDELKENLHQHDFFVQVDLYVFVFKKKVPAKVLSWFRESRPQSALILGLSKNLQKDIDVTLDSYAFWQMPEIIQVVAKNLHISLEEKEMRAFCEIFNSDYFSIENSLKMYKNLKDESQGVVNILEMFLEQNFNLNSFKVMEYLFDRKWERFFTQYLKVIDLNESISFLTLLNSQLFKAWSLKHENVLPKTKMLKKAYSWNLKELRKTLKYFDRHLYLAKVNPIQLKHEVKLRQKQMQML